MMMMVGTLGVRDQLCEFELQTAELLSIWREVLAFAPVGTTYECKLVNHYMCPTAASMPCTPCLPSATTAAPVTYVHMQ